MTKLTLVLMVLGLLGFQAAAQYKIEPPPGYSQDIGNMVTMLNDLKGRITTTVESLTQEETDFLLDSDSNRIGAMIYHLAATEAYYQVYTFENRSFTKEEEMKWATALSLGEDARKEFVGRPIAYYLSLYDEVRKKTLRLLKEMDDEWFGSEVGNSMTNHWAWYHVMEHQANHMGQIRLIAKRAAKKS